MINQIDLKEKPSSYNFESEVARKSGQKGGNRKTSTFSSYNISVLQQETKSSV